MIDPAVHASHRSLRFASRTAHAAVLVLIPMLSLVTGLSAAGQTTEGTVIRIGPSQQADRLGTVFESSGAFDVWWTDGYSLRIPGSGLTGPTGSPPTILIDGLPVPFDVFGRVNTGVLPASAPDIHTAVRQPGLQFTPAARAGYGSLAFSTVRPPGTTLRGSVVMVNDTGDPGPDLYRSGGRNVDRSGPRASVRASVNEGAWFVEGAFDTDEHHMTDERISTRIRSVFDEPVPAVIRVVHPHGRARYQSDALQVDVRAGYAASDDYLFVDALAREWTNRQTWTWLSGRAVRRLQTNWTAQFTFAGRDASMESRGMPFEGPTPLTHRTGSAEAALSREWPSGTTSLRTGLIAEDAMQADAFRRVGETLGYAGIGYERALSRSAGLELNARVAHPWDEALDPRAATSAAGLGVHARLGSIALEGGASVSSERRPPLSSISGLVAAGFDPGELGPAFGTAPFQTRTRITEVHLRVSGAQAGLSGNAGPARVRRWLDIRARRSQGLTVTDADLIHIRDIRFEARPRLASGVSGSAFRAAAGIDWRPSAALRAEGGEMLIRLSAHVRGVLSGSEAFRSWFSGLAPYRAQIDAEYAAGRIGIEASGRLEGPTNWSMYAGTPFERRPARTRVDVAVWKRVAGDAALLALSVRNLLDTPFRVHPAGIDEQMSVRVGMTVRFNRTSP